MSGLYPLSRMQQFDRNGRLLDGARLFLYDGGTSTPRTGYADGALTTQHPWPIQADASGRLPLIYLDDGYYRQRLTTKHGDLVFDDDGIPVLSAGGGGEGTTVDPNSLFKTRDIKIRFDNAPINGYVRLNGLSIGSSSSGATERANADTQPLFEELWPFSTIVVSGGKGANASSDFAANKKLILPNACGRALFGLDDMGGGPQGILTGSSVINPTLPGGNGGVEKVIISQSVLPNYQLSGPSLSVTVTGTTGGMDRNSTHNHSGWTGGVNRNARHGHNAYIPNIQRRNVALNDSSALVSTAGSNEQIHVDDADTDHEHYITVNTVDLNHLHAVMAYGATPNPVVSLAGGGAPLATLSPALLVTIYIRL